MKKIILQLEKRAGESRGSALLITLLMLGILMTLTLGISNLVIREISVTQSIVDANKGYYSAEAGVEQALLALKTGGEGAEPIGEVKRATLDVEVAPVAGGTSVVGSVPPVSDGLKKIDPGFAYEYKVSNQAEAVPGFDKDSPVFVETVAGDEGGVACQVTNAKNPMAIAKNVKDLYEDCPRATYRKLALNETQIIPLFSTDSSGNPQNVEDFLVEYYLNYTDGGGFYGSFQNLDVKMFDVLRWKIYGKPKYSTDVQRTESIADFYPAVENNGPKSPVCIGTDASIASARPESCIFPALTKPGAAAGALSQEQGLWSGARECYQTDAGMMGVFGGSGGGGIAGTAHGNEFGCAMKDFIDNHTENYLVLTNMVNPNIVGITDVTNPEQLAKADIYFRVVTKDGSGKLVKDFAEISSTGKVYKGDLTEPSVEKNLQVKYKSPKFLPVFNFSLYKVCASGQYDEDGLCIEK